MSTYKFTQGQKVKWSNGQQPHYYIETPFRDNGMNLYELKNEAGNLCGGRVREDELEDFTEPLEITPSEPVTIVTMQVEQIIETTLAKFNDVEVHDYGALVAPYRNVTIKDLETPQIFNEVEDLRKKLKGTRTNIERIRKALKEDSLKTGRAIDAKAKELTEPINEPEQYLKDLVEKFEAHKQAEEQRKKEALQKLVIGRIDTLAKYGHVITYDDALTMEEIAYQELLQEKKSNWEVEEALKAAAKEKAEKEEAERLERLRNMEEKEAELLLREQRMMLRELLLTRTAVNHMIKVPDDMPSGLANDILGEGYGYDWAYQSDRTFDAPDQIPLSGNCVTEAHLTQKPIDLPNDLFDALDATKDYESNRIDLPEYDSAGGHEVAFNPTPSNAVELTDEDAAILFDRSEFQDFVKRLEGLAPYWPSGQSTSGNAIAVRFSEVYNAMKSF